MNEDIVCLLQDLGRETSVSVIANFLIRNPDLEDLIAAEMGALLSGFDRSQPETRSQILPNFMNLALTSLTGSYKMIFVVNMELNMGRGKQCAQVAHAALGLYLDIQNSNDEQAKVGLNQWLSVGQKKIVVRGNNLEHLMKIKQEAEEARIPTILISDAGCTQIAPGSKTVLALFGSDDELHKITGSLKLL